MTTRKPKKTEPAPNPYADRHCGECDKMVWSFVFCNLDCNKMPIHGHCEESKEVHIRTDEACENFVCRVDKTLDFYALSQPKEEAVL